MRLPGFEPGFMAWEATVIPLNHSRTLKFIVCNIRSEIIDFVVMRAHVLFLNIVIRYIVLEVDIYYPLECYLYLKS